jgi:monofunctional biosynthetic peptidoglycan transglycosylase
MSPDEEDPEEQETPREEIPREAPAHQEPAQRDPAQFDAPAPVPEMREQDTGLFGEPEIAWPGEERPNRQRARDAQLNLDLDLGRIKRRKRYGMVLTLFSVLFVAFVLAPVTWVGAYAFFDPPGTVLMMQRAAQGESIRHRPVPISRMSPHVVRSVIAAEDANFCTHDGFDIEAIQDAMDSNARGRRTRGASTISQQVAKNLFLWPERSWIRKGFETYFTVLIEFMWPKRRIMEAYLNAAEWGDGVFGIEAAAQARFGVSAEELSPLQAARLAAVLPSPNRWRADSPGPYVRRRSASIVERARVVRNERMAACVLLLDRPQ